MNNKDDDIQYLRGPDEAIAFMLKEIARMDKEIKEIQEKLWSHNIK